MLPEDEQETLKELLVQLYSLSSEVQVNSLYCRYKFVLINKVKFMTSSTKKLSVVMANFNATSDDSLTVCPRQFVIPADASLRHAELISL